MNESREEHVRKENEYIEVCRSLTNALFQYLTFQARSCAASHPTDADLIKAVEFRDQTIDKLNNLTGIHESMAEGDPSKYGISIMINEVKQDLKEVEQDIEQIQRELENAHSQSS